MRRRRRTQPAGGPRSSVGGCPERGGWPWRPGPSPSRGRCRRGSSAAGRRSAKTPPRRRRTMIGISRASRTIPRSVAPPNSSTAKASATIAMPDAERGDRVRRQVAREAPLVEHVEVRGSRTGGVYEPSGQTPRHAHRLDESRAKRGVRAREGPSLGLPCPLEIAGPADPSPRRGPRRGRPRPPAGHRCPPLTQDRPHPGAPGSESRYDRKEIGPMNKVLLTGRLTRDPEMRSPPAGRSSRRSRWHRTSSSEAARRRPSTTPW